MITQEDVDKAKRCLAEMEAKLTEQDKLELPDTGHAIHNHILTELGSLRATKELAEIASSRMISANKLEAYASVLEPDYRWVEGGYSTVSMLSPTVYVRTTWNTYDFIGVPKMSKTTAEKICELLNNKEISL